MVGVLSAAGGRRGRRSLTLHPRRGRRARGFEGLAQEGQSGRAGGALFGFVDGVAVQARARAQILIAPGQRRVGHLDRLRRTPKGDGRASRRVQRRASA